MKNGPVLSILSNFPNDRKLAISLQPYFRVVFGSKRVDSNQPESGVFTRKLQFESIRLIRINPGYKLCENAPLSIDMYGWRTYLICLVFLMFFYYLFMVLPVLRTCQYIDALCVNIGKKYLIIYNTNIKIHQKLRKYKYANCTCFLRTVIFMVYVINIFELWNILEVSQYCITNAYCSTNYQLLLNPCF